MADNWEDDDYEEAEEVIKAKTDAWSGEDEEDDVKENWEDSEDEAKPAVQPLPKEKKKPLKERIAEKAAKRKEEMEERKRKEEEERKEMTAEELAAEKERMKLQEEEEQLMLAKDLIGVTMAPAPGIDSMKPETAEQFAEFSNKLKQKITEFEAHPLYTKFLEDLFRDLCVSMSSENTKKIGSSLNTLANEKQKMEKASHGKGKKKKGPAIKQVRTNDFDEGGYDDDFDDFM